MLLAKFINQLSGQKSIKLAQQDLAVITRNPSFV